MLNDMHLQKPITEKIREGFTPKRLYMRSDFGKLSDTSVMV